MEEENISENQSKNSEKPWLWKKGQSGNLKGRPKGKTLKEYAREYLSKMTDEEKDAWLDSLPKEKVWAMAEGNPENKTDITSAGKPIIQIASEIAEKNDINSSTEGNS